MSRLGTIARRSFLIGSAAVLGGVAFGYRWYHQAGENPLENNRAHGEAALTPYVLITPAGITLITPRADKGQGAYHVQAALIAEELDVDLAKVTVDPGPPSATYYNTALSGEAVPFPSTNDAAVVELMRGMADAAVKLMGIQITGGSTTVPDAFTKLRLAGAAARETLKLAASRETGIAVADLKTNDGRVILPDNRELRYEELAATAATLSPPRRVNLKPESEWRYIGKPMQRIDIVAKSTGTQTYGIDMRMDGMLHATVRTNPRMGAAMNSYDASAAEKMRGVKSIVPVTGGVAVIADNTWRAFQAADAILFDWKEAAYPAEMDGHWEALSSAFSPDGLDSRNRDDGDVDTALASGEILEAEYRAPYLAHAPLEPVSAVVLVADNRVDIWTGTQIPRWVENNVERITGIPRENIHVHVLMMGGSFGHRLEDDYIQRAVEAAMAVRGTPVKMTYSREEDFAHDFPRQIALARGRGRVSQEGVAAFDLDIAMPSVIASQMGDRQGLPVPGPDISIVAGAWDQPYAIPDYRVTGYRASGLAPISSWRSVGASTNGFFHESLLDEIIHKAGRDPLEERIRLMNHEPSRKVLEAVGEMSGWGGTLAPRKGRGVAFCLSFGTACAEVVEVTDTPDGIVIDKVWVAAEVGKIVDPVNFENLVQGGVIFGLGHAMNCEITFSDGKVEQTNFHAHEGMRLSQCPEIFVRGLENGSKVRGVGEPPVPPAAPALANAIFAATGKRLREMPFSKFVDFA